MLLTTLLVIYKHATSLYESFEDQPRPRPTIPMRLYSETHVRSVIKELCSTYDQLHVASCSTRLGVSPRKSTRANPTFLPGLNTTGVQLAGTGAGP